MTHWRKTATRSRCQSERIKTLTKLAISPSTNAAQWDMKTLTRQSNAK